MALVNECYGTVGTYSALEMWRNIATSESKLTIINVWLRPDFAYNSWNVIVAVSCV